MLIETSTSALLNTVVISILKMDREVAKPAQGHTAEQRMQDSPLESLGPERYRSISDVTPSGQQNVNCVTTHLSALL